MTTGTTGQASPTRFSLPELAYLLHLTHGAGPLARSRLLLTEPADDVLRSGLSSLVAHDGMRVDKGVLSPSPEAAVVTNTLADAIRWVEIGVSIGLRREVMHVVEGAGLVMLISRSYFGVLEFLGVNPELKISEAVPALVGSMCAPASPLGVLVVNAIGFDSPSRSFMAIAVGEVFELLKWNGEGPLEPGIVDAIVKVGARPGPGWHRLGNGQVTDLLSWCALAVSQGEPLTGGIL